MSQLFTSGGQSIGVSASTSVLPMNTQDWSPLGWSGWISLRILFSLHPYQHLLFVAFFMIAILTGVRWYLIVVSVFVSLSISNVEDETPILWPPDARNWLIWKDPDAGKDWRQEKEVTEDEMVGWHHRLNGQVWVDCGSWWWTGRPGMLQSIGLQIVGHDYVTEVNWTRESLRLQGDPTSQS